MRNLILLMLAMCMARPAWAQVDVDAYLRDDRFEDIKLSPTGEYFAATVSREDRTGLVIVNRADKKISNHFMLTRNTHVGEFTWVSDSRVVLTLAQKFGSRDQPYSTGELFGLDATGGRFDVLGGYRSNWGERPALAQQNQESAVFMEVADTLPADDRYVIVSVTPFSQELAYSSAARMDVETGRRSFITRSPVTGAHFTTDNNGRVRFARGMGNDNVNKLYYRADNDQDWRLINDEANSGRVEQAIGFSADDKIAYLWIENDTGPDSVVAWDIEHDQRKVILRDTIVDPQRVLYRVGTGIPVGALVVSDRARTVFFDPQGPEAKQYRALEKALPGEAVLIRSGTRDGSLLLAQTWSGSNPGQFFLYDTRSRKAENLLVRRQWLQEENMAQVEAFGMKARDGLPLHGYLTVPRDRGDRALPMVVVPHGGPFFVSDQWGFDDEAQLLAAAGYVVLQVNFRGSSSYGRAFQQAGARQWGGTMQDDLTDATRWAIENGFADPQRICIYGASYGAYAALMGAAKEPSLYRCAAGYVGIYDLPLMFKRGDTQDSRSGMTYLRDWVGDPAQLAAVSPVNLAERIKVPVFLAAGGEDERAPIQHSKKMEAALRKAGVPVRTLYYDTEGHGFYTQEHRHEFYGQLLAFLKESLGGQPAKAAAAQP